MCWPKESRPIETLSKQLWGLSQGPRECHICCAESTVVSIKSAWRLGVEQNFVPRGLFRVITNPIKGRPFIT